MSDLFHLYYRPEPDCDAEQRYRDLVLVVRDSLPLRNLAAIGVDPEPVIDRMLADGVIGPDLKPLHLISRGLWSEDLEALEDALIRLFA